MKTSKKYDPQKSIRWFLSTTLFLLLVIPVSYSQSIEYNGPIQYIGMEAGFGSRSFTIESNIPQLDQLTTVKGGGSFGFIYGTPVFKFPVSVGLYFMSVQEKRTIDLITFHTGVNMSLLQLLGVKNTRVDVYTLTGIDFENFTFMGTYLELPEDMPRRTILGEPLLGSKSILNADAGVGIEIRLMDDFQFVHLFIETKKIFPLTTNATELFHETNITHNLAVNIGLRIGKIR